MKIGNPVKVAIHLMLLLALAGCSGPGEPGATSQGTGYTLVHKNSAYFFRLPYEYYLFIPESYRPEEASPLFIGVHGAGGDGRQCLKWWQKAAEEQGFVLLCPSLADENGGWYAEQGIARLDSILKKVHIDVHVEQRYFLAGFSAGAEFVQIYAMQDVNAVTGVAVLSSGNYHEPSRQAWDIPYLVTIGEQDNPIAVGNARQFAGLLQQRGFFVEIYVLPDTKHEVTREALEHSISFYQETR
jgi:predicted esterase